MAIAVVAATVAVLAVAALPAYGAGPQWTAHVFFQRTNPFDPSGCTVLKLDLQVTQTTASADYWAADTCLNFDYSHLTGSTTLTSDQVSLGSFETASLTNAVIGVSGGGYIQQFTFNLTWTGSGQVTLSHPIGGTGALERQSAATGSGSVIDLGGRTAFSGSDATEADIVEVIHTVG